MYVLLIDGEPHQGSETLDFCLSGANREMCKRGNEEKPQIDRGHIGCYMSHSLNSLKGGYIGDYIGDYYRGY